MKTIVALCYFHRKIGPLVFYSYPESILDRELSVRIANIMDQTFNEGFFTHSFENLNSMNYYFEIHSDWARGNKEMLMISVIIDQNVQEIEENVHRLCNEFSERLQSNEEIFTAFYINDLNSFDEKDRDKIIRDDLLIKLWVKELYWAIIEETREKTEEEKIAYLLNTKHIFLTLEKLSKGPIALEELKEWFNEIFPLEDFKEMQKLLVEKQLIFITQIGIVDKYVFLLKEINAERIPPENVIEYFDETPELIYLLIPIIQDYFNNYVNKSELELKEDAFTLFQIIADPKKYNILSELRDGLIQKDKLPKLVSKKSLDFLIEIIDFLKEKDIIEELKYNNEIYCVLKTNIQITTAFPEYLRKLLPKETEPVIANRYSPRIMKKQVEMAEIFKDVRNKGKKNSKITKINKFLEDLSSSVKKNSLKK